MRSLRRLLPCLLVGIAVNVGAAFNPEDFASPLLPIPELLEPPLLGAPEDVGCWRGATRFSGFTELNTGLPAVFDTEVWLGHCRGTFYLRFRCHAPKGSVPVCGTSIRDGQIWREDSVEIFLAENPAEEQRDYYQFVVSAANAQLDLRRGGMAWDGKWESHTKVLDDGWIVTVGIPFSTLAHGRTPASLRFNFARNAISPRPESSVLAWLGRRVYYPDARSGGVLDFSLGTPAAAVERQGDFSSGVIRMKVDAVSLPQSGFAKASLCLRTLGGKTLASVSQQPRFDSRTVELGLPEVKDGLYVLRFALEPTADGAVPAYYGGTTHLDDTGEAAKPWMRLEWPVVVNNKARLDFDLKLSGRGKRLDCRTHLFGSLPGGRLDQLKCRFTLLELGGKTIASLGEVPMHNNTAVLRCDLPEIPGRGRFKLLAELLSDKEKMLSGTAAFATPPAPEWLVPKPLPDDRAVPAPWTPVELQGRTVTVWGRTYEFKESPVPSQITSQGIALLAAPCRLVSEPAIAGWELESTRLEGARAAVFKWRGATKEGVQCQAQSKVEFDGVLRVDVSIPKELKARSLRLDIPYRKELAKFVHRGPVQFGGIFTTYPLPDKAQSHPICPNFYLLNDSVGLCWFDGMRFDWPLRHPERAIEISSGVDSVCLSVNYVDEPSTCLTPRTYTFGIEAIPVRPLPNQEPGLRKWYSYRYGDEDAEHSPAWLSTVSYMAKNNIDMVRGTAELWVKPDFAPAGHQRPEVFFEASHGRNWMMRLCWMPSGTGICAQLDEPGVKTTLASGLDLKAKEWTHVAITWGDELSLYVDGVKRKSVGRKGGLKVFPVNIFAGGNRVLVDGLRVSGVPRASFDLRSPPRADADTLLLDNFEEGGWVNGRRATIPDKIAPAAEAGYLSPDASLAPGKWGTGVDSMKVPVKSLVEGMAFLGMKDVQFHAAQYTDEACAGLYIKDENAFRKAVDAIHKAGMRVLLYANNSISTRDRLWDAYADDWLIEPRGTPFVQPSIPDEKVYQACPRSEYAEYFFGRLGQLMDQYRVDGFFLDGRMYATCQNHRHGCGVTNFNGKMVAERDVWDGREKQLRMYRLIKERGGYCEQHKSGNWDAPSCFFWDCVWEGEQFMGVDLGTRKRLDLLPLFAMRAQMNGIPYGMPSRYAAYPYSPFMPLDNCTYAFVHGTTWGMCYRVDEALVLWPFWKALDQFGAKYQDFRPYWGRCPPALSVPDCLLKVSAYVQPGKALLIAANFCEDKALVEGDIELDLAALGLSRPVAKDAFSGKPLQLKGGRFLSVSIKSFRQAWFLLEEVAGTSRDTEK